MEVIYWGYTRENGKENGNYYKRSLSKPQLEAMRPVCAIMTRTCEGSRASIPRFAQFFVATPVHYLRVQLKPCQI